MTRRGVIEIEPPQQCDECSEVAELRPYGPGGKKICYLCFTSHPEWEEEAGARFAHLCFGEPLPEKFRHPR